MDVQDQLASHEPGNQTRQDQQVRHVVNVNDVQPGTKVQGREFQGAQQAGHEILVDIPRRVSALPADGEPVDVHGFARFPRASDFLRQGYDVKLHAIARQGFRLAPDPWIRQIAGVRKHRHAGCILSWHIVSPIRPQSSRGRSHHQTIPDTARWARSF